MAYRRNNRNYQQKASFREQEGIGGYDIKDEAAPDDVGEHSKYNQGLAPEQLGSAEWVHDRYEENNTHRPYKKNREAFKPLDSYRTPAAAPKNDGVQMTIRGLPYDISRTEIQELCERFGNPLNVHLVYDRTDRSTGIAHITYATYDEAKDAVHEIDGAKAHGQPVSAIIRPPPAKRSLFERIEYPAGRRNSADKGRANNRRNNNNSSDDAEESGYQSSGRHTYNTSSRTSGDKGTGRPALDRYVPPQRAGRDRTLRNRDAAPLRPRNGGNRVDRKTESGGRGGRRNERPRKTQEQMDMELDDYFSKGAAAAESGADSKAAEVPAVPLTIQHDDMELEL